MNKTHGMSKTRVYRSWAHMLYRCENPNDLAYQNYGGRGITVCPAWHDFRNFYADMGDCPEGLTLDRQNNGGNYEPGNCRWATWVEQQNNRRPKSCGPQEQRMFIAMNREGTMIASNNQSKFAREHGLNSGHISSCLREKRKQHKGWRFKCLKK